MTVNIEIPGGKATLRDKRSELTQRRLEPIEAIGARLGRGVLEGLTNAGRILCEGDVIDDRTDQLDDEGKPVFDGPDVDLSERQLAQLTRMGRAVAWALLASWTLDQPLPATPDDLLDLDPDLYQALILESAKVNAKIGGGGFTVDEAMDTRDLETGEPDTSLPTGA